MRGKGSVLRPSLDEPVTLEYVDNVWNQVTDMSEATHLNAIAEASGSLLEVLENLKSADKDAVEDTFEFGNRELILYALGTGATTKNTLDMRYLYENDADFSALPSFFIQPGLNLTMSTNLVSSALPNSSADLTNILHGEQYLEVLDDLPTSGKLITKGKVIDVMDKGSGALVVFGCDSYDTNGRQLTKSQISVFVVGAGNFGGKKQPIAAVVPLAVTPSRAPDASIEYKTNEDQAALYRLSGDRNPLHIDPDFARMSGFKTPILHGLCSLGFSVRAVLSKYANNNSALFKAIKVRFSGPVLPGQTLKVDMWKQGTRIHFRTIVSETGKEVISGAYVDLKDSKAKL